MPTPCSRSDVLSSCQARAPVDHPDPPLLLGPYFLFCFPRTPAPFRGLIKKIPVCFSFFFSIPPEADFDLLGIQSPLTRGCPLSRMKMFYSSSFSGAPPSDAGPLLGSPPLSFRPPFSFSQSISPPLLFSKPVILLVFFLPRCPRLLVLRAGHVFALILLFSFFLLTSRFTKLKKCFEHSSLRALRPPRQS